MIGRNFTLAALAVVGVISGCLLAQQKPLTNVDVIKMVKGGLPESVVVSAIRSTPSKFDISPDGLIALHKAGVTQNEMDAIVASANPNAAPSAASAAAAPAAPPVAAPAPPVSHLPTVALMTGGSSQLMTMERTQLAQTKQKPSSMSSLASDSALGQSMQAGVNTSAMAAMSHSNSAVGGSLMGQAGGVFTGMMSHRKPSVTYVWGVPGPSSANISPTNTPAFAVNFSSVLGTNPDEFEPEIVKLTPAQNTCRIVGATQGKEDASSSPAADWQIYNGFLEERVPLNAHKTGRGQYQISPSSPLLPGEYGVVLRPVLKSKKFSGGDVARNQGDGMMFDAVWSFQVQAQ